MKALLISIRPQWVEKILNGIKTDEIRKGTAIGKAINRLIKEQGVAPMLIYCTKDKWLLYDKEQQTYFSTNKKKGSLECHSINSDYFSNLSYEIEICEHLEGKVVARFNATVDFLELKMIESGLYFAKPDKEVIELDLNENAQIDNWQLLNYTGEKLGTKITDIHIHDLEIFDRPKELSEFVRKETIIAPYMNYKSWDYLPLTRAPQSWCYVEV